MCRQGKGVAISSFDFSIFDLDISRWQSITFLSQWRDWMNAKTKTNICRLECAQKTYETVQEKSSASVHH